MPSILITGVSSGIGKACAERYADAGWHVVGTIRDVQRSAGIARPGTLDLEPLDLAQQGSGSDLAARVLDRYGCPDVLLNNAGTLLFGPIEDAGPDALEHVFRVNVFEQLALINALVPAMRERGSGTIANVTSLGGRMTFPYFGVYNASKHAIEGFSEGLWHELKPFGIRVKAIEPGFVETAIWGKVLPEQPDELDAPEPYRSTMLQMLRFEKSISKRTPPVQAAEEIWRAVNDTSDRLRYPVAAYARPILAARRWLGEQRVMRLFHRRWMGEY